MTKFLFFVTGLLCALPCFAQSLHSNSGYNTVGIYSRNFNDVFSFAANQAALSQIKNTMMGVYSERRFMLKELTQYSAVIAAPTKFGGTALVMDFMGGTDYSQSTIGFAYGRALGEKAGLGMQFNYNLVHIAGYGNTGNIDIELGTILHLTDKLHAGCHIYNPIKIMQSKHSNQAMPSVYSFGVGYEASDQLLIQTIIDKEENRPIIVHVSLHYALAKQFFLRGGISTLEGFSFVGAGLIWKNLRTDVSASWHPRLGFSPSLLLVFSFEKGESIQ